MPQAMCPFNGAKNAAVMNLPTGVHMGATCKHYYDFGGKDDGYVFVFRHWLRGFRTVQATPDQEVIVPRG